MFLIICDSIFELISKPIPMEQPLQSIDQTLFADIQALIESSRQDTFVDVNAEITMLYWRIGKHFNHS